MTNLSNEIIMKVDQIFAKTKKQLMSPQRRAEASFSCDELYGSKSEIKLASECV